MTIAEIYAPAMAITSQEEADAWFNALVVTALLKNPALSSVEEAELQERSNLAYFAGYYPHETRLRVEQLFKCQHPFLGPAALGQLDAEKTLLIGMKTGEMMKANKSLPEILQFFIDHPPHRLQVHYELSGPVLIDPVSPIPHD